MCTVRMLHFKKRLMKIHSNSSVLYYGFNSLFATFTDLHVRKRATFADLHSYTHAYCSFVLLNEAITIVSGSRCAHGLLIWLLGFLHTIYR